MFAFQTLGVMADAAESVATGAEVDIYNANRRDMHQLTFLYFMSEWINSIPLCKTYIPCFR